MKTTRTSSSKVGLYGLILAAVGVAFGRGWLHLLNRTPYGTYIYNEKFTQSFWENTIGIDFLHLITDSSIQRDIKQVIFGLGVFILIYGILTLLAPKINTALFSCISYLFIVILFFYTFCMYLDEGQMLLIALEQTLQLVSPFLLLIALRQKKKTWLVQIAMIATAITFIAHGLFALGIPYQPGHFKDMLIKTFGITESTSGIILVAAGILDLLAAICIFLPSRFRIKWWAIYYLIIWGAMTTFARIVSNIYMDIFWDSLIQWIPHFLYRVPHFIIPLWILFQWRKTKTLSS